MSSNLYWHIVQSIKKLCVDLAAEFQTDGVATPVLIDWDEHADIHELPNGDLIGPAGCGITTDGSMTEVVFAIGVSTMDDKGLFKLRKMIARIYDRLAPENQIDIYDAATATRVTWMVMARDTSVTPMTKAETRPYQFVEARGLIDPRAPSVL